MSRHNSIHQVRQCQVRSCQKHVSLVQFIAFMSFMIPKVKHVVFMLAPGATVLPASLAFTLWLSHVSVKDLHFRHSSCLDFPLAVMSVNRAVKRARVVQQPPMMMMPQQPMFHQQPMFQPVMQQVMVPGQGAVIEEDFDDVPEADATSAGSRSGRPAPPPGPSYEKGKSAEIPRSVTYIFKLPRARLSEACEELNENLDGSVTCELSNQGLLILIWLLTRLRPSTSIAAFSA